MNRGVRIISLLLIATLFTGGALADSHHDELQEKIEEKKAEVEQLNKQIEQTEGRIESLHGQAQTLQGAISQINKNIEQTTLGIRSSELNIEKLGLEIESLGYELQEVRAEVAQKQAQVANLLRTVQRRDKNTFLESILTSKSLAQGVAEINALTSLQDNVGAQVRELSETQDRLRETIVANDQNKSQLEVEVVNLASRKEILDDQREQKDVLLAQTRNQESQYQNLLTDLERQQQNLIDEISDIESQLSKNFDRSSVPSRTPGSLIWPVTLSGQRAGVLTQHYGETAYSSRYYKGRPHNGTDIGAPTGTEVRAAANGTVAHVDYNGLYYQYGRYIMIDHGNGLSTLYAHLSGSVVSVGQSVTQGALIGYVGNTGFSTGPHLHFGLYATPAGGWSRTSDRSRGGLMSIPPATGLVPIGVTLNPEQYM